MRYCIRKLFAFAWHLYHQYYGNEIVHARNKWYGVEEDLEQLIKNIKSANELKLLKETTKLNYPKYFEENIMTKKNPIAKALRSPHLKPRKINSKKIYKRKPKHKK